MSDQTSNKFGELTETIIGAAIEVHRTLGPGLLESVYSTCLRKELRTAGLEVESEVSLPVLYKGELLDFGYRVDMIVESRVIVEIKAVEALAPIHKAQVITYLKLAGVPTGLLINFNVTALHTGIKRLHWPPETLLIS